MIFDTHAHYDDPAFDADRDNLLSSMVDQGVGTIVDMASTWDSLEPVLQLAQKYPFIYAALGIYPEEVGDLNEETFARLKTLLQQDRVVAVGEIGLDYHRDSTPPDLQQYWFLRQLELARELDLPVVVHSRDAASDTFEILQQHAAGLNLVLHCYSYSKEQAKAYVKQGFYLGVGGVVTFKNGRKLKETVAEVPLTSLVLETDCPYLAPEPHRGQRNDSTYLHYVAEEIGRIKGISTEQVIAQTEENARTLYRL